MSTPKRITTECPNCSRVVSKSNFERHYNACAGLESKIWNAGLTKETDERVRRNAKTISEATIGKLGRPQSDQAKLKLSNFRKKFITENPDKVPYLSNHSSRESYPEKYWSECLGSNVPREFKVLRYSLDFANPKTKRYLEIDGEQHYVDQRIVDHDANRTRVLVDLGWTGMRIRWKDFCKLEQKDKEARVEEARQFLL